MFWQAFRLNLPKRIPKTSFLTPSLGVKGRWWNKFDTTHINKRRRKHRVGWSSTVKDIQNKVFFHGNLCLRDPFVIPQEIFSQPTHTFNDYCEYRLQIQSPSTLSITAITLKKMAFYTAGRVAAHTVPCLPPKPYWSDMCFPSKNCSTLTLLFSTRKSSNHGTANSCHLSIPSDLSSPSAFPEIWKSLWMEDRLFLLPFVDANGNDVHWNHSESGHLFTQRQCIVCRFLLLAHLLKGTLCHQ